MDQVEAYFVHADGKKTPATAEWVSCEHASRQFLPRPVSTPPSDASDADSPTGDDLWTPKTMTNDISHRAGSDLGSAG